MMNEIEKAAMTALPTVLTIDASRLLIRLMFSSGLICSVMAWMIENSSSRMANVCLMKCSSDISGSWK